MGFMIFPKDIYAYLWLEDSLKEKYNTKYFKKIFD